MMLELSKLLILFVHVHCACNSCFLIIHCHGGKSEIAIKCQKNIRISFFTVHFTLLLYMYTFIVLLCLCIIVLMIILAFLGKKYGMD